MTPYQPLRLFSVSLSAGKRHSFPFQSMAARWAVLPKVPTRPSTLHFHSGRSNRVAIVTSAWPLPCLRDVLKHVWLLVLCGEGSQCCWAHWDELPAFSSSSRPGGEEQWSGRKLVASKCPRKRKMTAKIPKARRKNGEARSDKYLLFFPLVSRDTPMLSQHSPVACHPERPLP